MVYPSGEVETQIWHYPQCQIWHCSGWFIHPGKLKLQVGQQHAALRCLFRMVYPSGEVETASRITLEITEVRVPDGLSIRGS